MGAFANIIWRGAINYSRRRLPNPMRQRFARQEARDAATPSQQQTRPPSSEEYFDNVDGRIGDRGSGGRRNRPSPKAPPSDATRGSEGEIEAAPTKQSTTKARSHRIAASEVVPQGGPKGEGLLQSPPRRTFKGTKKEADPSSSSSSSSSSSFVSQTLAPLISSAKHVIRQSPRTAEKLLRADERFHRVDAESRIPEIRVGIGASSSIPLPSRRQGRRQRQRQRQGKRKRKRQRQRQGKEGLGGEEGSDSHVGGELISSGPRALAYPSSSPELA